MRDFFLYTQLRLCVYMQIKAYVLLKVGSGNERDICNQISNFEEVIETGIIYGEYDIIAKIGVGSMMDLENFLTEKVRNISNIILTSTMIIAREYKGLIKRNSMKTQSN